MPRGTALWESLLGKPQGKATDSLIHAKGSVTLLLQLDSKAHLYAPTRDEDVHKFPKIHFSTGEESSGSGTDSTQGLRPRHRRERNLKRRRSPQERREELQGRATIPRDPRCLSNSRETSFPCTVSTFKQMIDSHHVATWDSPVGKPRGKASRESHRSLVLREGKRELLLHLGRKLHVHAPTSNED